MKKGGYRHGKDFSRSREVATLACRDVEVVRETDVGLWVKLGGRQVNVR